MDLTIAKSDLLPLVSRCQGAISPKSPHPALANVWISVNGGALDVSATDNFIGASSVVDLEESSKADAIGIHGRDLLDRIKALPDGGVRLQTKKGAVLVSATKGVRSFSLPYMPESERPTIAKPTGDDAFDVPACVLSDLIDRTHYAIATDETRAHVNSAMVETFGSSLRVVATNGHMLATSYATIDNAPTKFGPILVPLKAVTEIRKLLASVEPSAAVAVSLSAGRDTAFFTVGGSVLSVRLVDAQFPPWEQVIPKDQASKAKVSRGEFSDAVRAVAVASEKGKAAITLDFKADTLAIRAGADAFDQIPCSLSGDGVSIGVNYSYILNVVDSVACEDVELSFGGELDPIVITAPYFVAVVMPMRV